MLFVYVKDEKKHGIVALELKNNLIIHKWKYFLVNYRNHIIRI
jgi:hypothetical protein